MADSPSGGTISVDKSAPCLCFVPLLLPRARLYVRHKTTPLHTRKHPHPLVLLDHSCCKPIKASARCLIGLYSAPGPRMRPKSQRCSRVEPRRTESIHLKKRMWSSVPRFVALITHDYFASSKTHRLVLS